MKGKRNLQDTVDRLIPVHVTQVTYSLLKNLGNYENERIELTANVYKGEDPNEISLQLKKKAMDVLKVLSRLNR